MELMLESIREMIIYAIEFLIFLFVYNTFLEVKPRYKGIYIGIGLAYCFMIVAGEYYAYPLRNIIYYVYIFTTCFYLFNGKFILKLGILFLSLYLDLILEETLIIGVSFILQKDYAVVSESKLLAQVVVQYIKFIILVGFSRVYKLYIKKNPQKKQYMNHLGGTVTTLLIILPISSYIILAIFLETFIVNLTKMEALIMESAVMCCLLAFNILIIVCINKVIANKEYEYTNAMIKEQLIIQFNHYKYLERINRETRGLKHDMKNHMICIQSLLKNNKNEEAITYVENVTKRIEQLGNKINTGDTIIDAILQEKLGRAEEQNIALKVKGRFVAPLEMDAMDKCTLFANALDNAIEACVKIEEVRKRTISVELAHNREYLIISICNPIAENIQIQAGKIKTSKKDTKYHGFGIENMRAVAEKYDMHFKTEVKEEQFCVEMICSITSK